MEFPEILDPIVEDPAFSEAKARLRDMELQLSELAKRKDVQYAAPIALPSVAVGMFLGVVGGKALRGTVGLGVGALGVWLTYQMLNSTSKEKPVPFAESSAKRGYSKIAAPMQKPMGCCSN